MSYRLLKVICQAILVAEDEDGDLVEHPCEPVVVPAKELTNYPGQLFTQIAALTNGKELTP